jgi:(p)ppGpp synthase/HD superfamily hydrolase
VVAKYGEEAWKAALTVIGEPSDEPRTQAALAETIARKAHASQIEKLSGDPYIKHIERVVALVDGDEAKAVAWLHDIIEDTPTTAADLTAAGVSPAVVKAVVLLTHGDEPYADYILMLKNSGDALALAVKRADLLDHLRPMTWTLPAKLKDKYEPALKELS